MDVPWPIVLLLLTVVLHAGMLVERRRGSKEDVESLQDDTSDLPEIRQQVENLESRVERQGDEIVRIRRRILDYLPALVERSLERGETIHFSREQPDEPE